MVHGNKLELQLYLFFNLPHQAKVSMKRTLTWKPKIAPVRPPKETHTRLSPLCAMQETLVEWPSSWSRHSQVGKYEKKRRERKQRRLRDGELLYMAGGDSVGGWVCVYGELGRNGGKAPEWWVECYSFAKATFGCAYQLNPWCRKLFFWYVCTSILVLIRSSSTLFDSRIHETAERSVSPPVLRVGIIWIDKLRQFQMVRST